MSANDGGPAFPFTLPAGNGHEQFDYPGMTLRDYFAGQIMASAMTRTDSRQASTAVMMQAAAEVAYEAADYMLVARAK